MATCVGRTSRDRARQRDTHDRQRAASSLPTRTPPARKPPATSPATGAPCAPVPPAPTGDSPARSAASTAPARLRPPPRPRRTPCAPRSAATPEWRACGTRRRGSRSCIAARNCRRFAQLASRLARVVGVIECASALRTSGSVDLLGVLGVDLAQRLQELRVVLGNVRQGRLLGSLVRTSETNPLRWHAANFEGVALFRGPPPCAPSVDKTPTATIDDGRRDPSIEIRGRRRPPLHRTTWPRSIRSEPTIRVTASSRT